MNGFINPRAFASSSRCDDSFVVAVRSSARHRIWSGALAVLVSSAALAEDPPDARAEQTLDWLSKTLCTCVVNDAIKHGASPAAISEEALQSGLKSCSPERSMKRLQETGTPPAISYADIGDGTEETIRTWGPIVAGCSKSMFDASLRDFKIRSAVTHALIAARPVQGCVSEHNTAGAGVSIAAGDCHGETAVAGQSSGVADIRLSKDGAIAIKFGAGLGAAEGKTIELTATIQSGGKLLWSCAGGDLQPLYRPPSCR